MSEMWLPYGVAQAELTLFARKAATVDHIDADDYTPAAGDWMWKKDGGAWAQATTPTLEDTGGNVDRRALLFSLSAAEATATLGTLWGSDPAIVDTAFKFHFFKEPIWFTCAANSAIDATTITGNTDLPAVDDAFNGTRNKWLANLFYGDGREQTIPVTDYTSGRVITLGAGLKHAVTANETMGMLIPFNVGG